VLIVPLAFTLALTGTVLFPALHQNPNVLRAFLGAGAVLLVWDLLIFLSARRAGRTLAIEIVARKQHYV
jgi:hypothetical protein